MALATGSLRPSFLILGILLTVAFFVAVRLPDEAHGALAGKQERLSCGK